jgi:two-component system LytT family response regulator
MLKAAIITDDRSLNDTILQTAEAYCPNVTIAGQAEGIQSGMALINTLQPDLVILDTRLKDGSGFDLLKLIENPAFKVIFISLYIEYSLKAFKHNAVDYLLKPVDPEELAQAINKALEMITYDEKLQLKMLDKNLKVLNKKDKILLKTNEYIHMVNVEDIIRIEADGNYSTFYLADQRKILVSRPINNFEEQLIDQGFVRIHRSHIININRLKYFDKAEGGYVVMTDGSTLPVASRKRDLLLDLFESQV